ncbi:hypothetical protein [Dyadobacter sp. CY323]|uniref:hypothetical protein n=1 Tax=Dyadobacter sp. CY323 TaxID=2907302 RepID=UPI001F1AEDA3|nr:hypothetical protein [Dyadobacter sp. CY323]MCE6987527.1 hypothetical protein [Dyadobacter sp. CY323]
MIQFDFDWSDLLNKVILGFAFALLLVQLWLLFKRRTAGTANSSGRFALKLFLNVLLWIGLVGFITQPFISRKASSKVRLLPAANVPAVFTDKILNGINAEQITLSELSTQNADTLVVVGQDFPPALFSQISQLENQPVVQWIPYFEKGQPQHLQWKGVARKGEMQTIYGRIETLQNQVIQVKYGNQTLDSASLKPGTSDFRLKFPVFTQGRTEMQLTLGDKTLDTIRFFARPSEMLTVRFLLDSPDFETRNLATWLGKTGNAIKYEAILSKDLKANQNINAAREPNLIVTDPGNASDVSVKKALNNGKSILFINLTDPPAEVRAINTALGTKFQIRKISNEPAVRISPELNALPFQFVKSGYHLELKPYPVMTENTKGKVAISLLTETFPMQLTGDSVTYEKVWNAIIALVRPVSTDNVDISAPVYQGLKSEFVANHSKDLEHEIRIGNDTLFTQKSILNDQSASGIFLPTESGWVTIQDSIPFDLYVEKSGTILKAAQMADFIHAHSKHLSYLQQSAKTGQGENLVTEKLSDGFWFAWMLICLTALWVEAKF